MLSELLYSISLLCRNSCMQFLTCAALQMSCAGHGCSTDHLESTICWGHAVWLGRAGTGKGRVWLMDRACLSSSGALGVCCPLPCPTVQEQPRSAQRGGRDGQRHSTLCHTSQTVSHTPHTLYHAPWTAYHAPQTVYHIV